MIDTTFPSNLLSDLARSPQILLVRCLELLAKGTHSNNTTLPIIIMAAWQHSSSFRGMPSAVSTPTDAARGVGLMQQDRNHHGAANRHCVDSQSAVVQVHEVPSSFPTPTSTSTVSGGDRESDTTAIPTSSNARNKKGTSKHGGCGDGSSGAEAGGGPAGLLAAGLACQAPSHCSTCAAC